MEYFGVGSGLDDFGEVLTVGVGDKDLTKFGTLYHLHNAFHTLAVQSVKDIVKQQNRDTSRPPLRGGELIREVKGLCQFHSEDECALLALRTDLLQGVVAKTHFEIVFMNTLRGPAEYEIPLTRTNVRFA